MERVSAETEARSALISLIGGLGVAGGLITATIGVLQRRDEQSAELFFRAMDKVTDPTTAGAQIYAVNALDRLADQSAVYRAAVESRLFDLIQQRTLELKHEEASRLAAANAAIATTRDAGSEPASPATGKPVVVTRSSSEGQRSADPLIQAAVEALGRPGRGPRRRPTRLEGLRLTAIHMDGLDLDRCCLRNGEFLDGHLNETSFRQSSLRNGKVIDCELEGADFRGTDLRGATIIASGIGIKPDGSPGAAGRSTSPRVRFHKAWYNADTTVEPEELLDQLRKEGRRYELGDPLIPGCR